MAESSCSRCHARCSHCASSRGISTDSSSCFCDELQNAHLETFHCRPLLQSDPLLSAVDTPDIWTGDEHLASLYHGQSDFLYEFDFARPSTPNNTIGFADVVVSHSIDLQSTELQTNAPRGDMPPGSLVEPTQPTASTAVLNNGTPSYTTSHQEPRSIQNLPSTVPRRRDYTKEEKNAFELWITNNPNPNRAQRVRYAQMNGLVKSQVDNLINNRKRDLKRGEKGAEQVASVVNTTLGSATRPKDAFFGNDPPSQFEPHPHESDRDMLPDCNENLAVESTYGFAHNEMALPVSEENLRRSLKANSSYSSIDEYLRSPEEGAPMESIQCALDNTASAAIALLQRKKLTEEMLGPKHKATCCLCTRVLLYEEVVVFPCLRWFHGACIASCLDFLTSNQCPVCRQSIYGDSQEPCTNFKGLSSPRNIRKVFQDHTQALESQNQSPKPRRTSQQGPRRDSSTQNIRGRYSTVSSGHGSAASSVVSGNSAYSYASSASRARAKKMRREKHMNDALGYSCSFCEKRFKKSNDMVTHEIEQHCLPQTFPCTFCHQRFGSPISWQKHETANHCEAQSTWFCMLDGDIHMEKCLFCEYIMPDVEHYEKVHLLIPCRKPLISRAFTTRQYLMGHLIEVHGMTEEEVTPVADELRFWALKLNVKHKRSGGIWRCGYCGLIGADWDNRIGHIIDHWNRGGPRFTKSHRWGVEQTKLNGADYNYIRQLITGKDCGSTRPHNMRFRGFDTYEAAVRHRANTLNRHVRSFSWKPFWANPKKDVVTNEAQSLTSSVSPSLDSVDKMDQSDISLSTNPGPQQPASFLGSLFTSLVDLSSPNKNESKTKIRKGLKGRSFNS